MEIKNIVFGLLAISISCSNMSSQTKLTENTEAMSDAIKKETNENLEIDVESADLLDQTDSKFDSEALLLLSYPETNYEKATKKAVLSNGEIWILSSKKRVLTEEGMPDFVTAPIQWRLESKISENGIDILSEKLKQYVDSEVFGKTADQSPLVEPTILTINYNARSYFASFGLSKGQEINEVHLELMSILNAHIISEGVPLEQE